MDQFHPSFHTPKERRAGGGSVAVVYLGLEKMAEACPGTSLGKLAWLVAWHIRDESYYKVAGRASHRPQPPEVPDAGQFPKPRAAPTLRPCGQPPAVRLARDPRLIKTSRSYRLR